MPKFMPEAKPGALRKIMASLSRTLLRRNAPDRETPPPPGRTRGTVKWFNNAKGFGFLTADGGKDIFVHYSAVEGDRYPSGETLIEGEAVEFEIVPGNKGPAAHAIRRRNRPPEETNEQPAASSVEAPSAQLALTLLGGKIRLVELEQDGQYKFVDGFDHLHELLYVYSTGSAALKRAVEELEELINSPQTREQQLHDFFEANPDFILNDDYQRAHSKVVLARDDEGPLIPDFVLEPAFGPPLCDLLELKLPRARVMVMQGNRSRFSADVLEAAAQLREYSAYFDDPSCRNRVRAEYGITSYRPRMFVVIGRRGHVDPIMARRAESDLPSLHLRTYDDVLARMKERLRGTQRP